MSIQGSRQRILDSVLPHEVTHTIFASHFRQPLPRWADEGACTTVEHASERAKQEKMLIEFLPYWVADYLAAWLFLVLTLALMGGFPVTFTMMGSSFLFGLIGLPASFFDLMPLRMWGIMNNTMLMAVPLFIFMGLTLERSGLAKDLLETMESLFRGVRGGRQPPHRGH